MAGSTYRSRKSAPQRCTNCCARSLRLSPPAASMSSRRWTRSLLSWCGIGSGPYRPTSSTGFGLTPATGRRSSPPCDRSFPAGRREPPVLQAAAPATEVWLAVTSPPATPAPAPGALGQWPWQPGARGCSASLPADAGRFGPPIPGDKHDWAFELKWTVLRATAVSAQRPSQYAWREVPSNASEASGVSEGAAAMQPRVLAQRPVREHGGGVVVPSRGRERAGLMEPRNDARREASPLGHRVEYSRSRPRLHRPLVDQCQGSSGRLDRPKRPALAASHRNPGSLRDVMSDPL